MTTAVEVGAQNWKFAPCVTNPPDISKLSYDEASDAVNSDVMDIMGARVKNICHEYITNLVNEIRHGNLDDDKKVLALYFLGALHPSDTNSIEVLIEYIDLKASRFDPAISPRRWGEYPAEEALIVIGFPSINPILEHLPTETNELRRHLMCKVLILVESRKGQVFYRSDGKMTAENQINQKISDESDPVKKANLELALKELEK